MQVFLRYAVAFIAAVLSASLLASIFSTQSVVASLQQVGTDVSFSTRISMTLGDLKILETLVAVISACFLIGFLVATLCNKLISNNRNAWFILAGACALVTALLLISWFLQLMPIAGARSFLGLSSQAFAGAVGGYIFSKLTAPIAATK